MTRKEALKKLEAHLECMNLSLSGKCIDYGYDCGNCKLGHKQGNKFEVNESLKIAYDALKQTIAIDDFSKTDSIESFKTAMELIKKYKGR